MLRTRRAPGSVGASHDDHSAAAGEPPSLDRAAARCTAMLCQTLSQLNREVPPEHWARVVLPLVVEALDADAGAILRAAGETEAEVLAAYGPTRKRGYPYPALDLHDPLLAALTQRSASVAVSGAQRHTVQPALRAICHPRFGVACVASAFMGHSLAGFVALSRRHDRPLSTEESACLTAVADAVGLALGTAALSQQSSMSEMMLETACAVAQAISGSLDLSHTFRQIAHSAARVMGDCNCLLLELDGESGDLVAVACSDPGDDVLLGLHVRFEDSPSNREALTQRRSIVVEDLVWGAGADRAYRDRLEIRSALFVPIHSEEELIGSLLLYSTARRDRYSASDIARAETVAEQAASAICNARLYRDLERSESRARDLLERITRLRERQRLTFANVLHDDVVQTVVAALYQVEGLRAAAGDEPREDLDRVAAMLKQTIAEARGVIWDLRPPVLEGLGLGGALEALAKRVAGDDGLTVETQIADVPALSPSLTTALYVIAREALQNARRHAHARRCVLCLRADATTAGDRRVVRLLVSDDGEGFDPGAVSAADHFGLTMMDEQAALVGGAIQVRSRPGEGTTVEVIVALSAED